MCSHLRAQHRKKVEIMAKKKALPEVEVRNFVAKHMNDFNKSQTFVDRKKDAKRGYSKHKKGGYSNDYLPFFMAA
jgi:hypothetical protein